MSTLERRYFKTELRASTKGSTKTIAGYAAVFGRSIRPEMQAQLGFNERCQQGCFQRSIRSGADVLCLQNHDKNFLMGRVANRSLQLREDAKGLFFECTLPETSVARDLHALVTRGDLNSCSFGFTVPDNGDKWTKENGQITRTLTDVDISDCSVVTDPAYLDTEVNASRSEKDDDDVDDLLDELDLEEKSLQEVERMLFPQGIPLEVRSHMQLHRRRSGIVSVRERMKMRLELSERV
jgi:uncharacterized protein